jgi:Cd2+/Zn2+-exporting ATPase
MSDDEGLRNHGGDHEEPSWAPLAASGALIAAGLVVRYATGMALVADAMLLAAMLVSGYRVASAGLRSLLSGGITIDLLITVAAVGATAIGHLEEGASVVFLFSLAERLEDYASDRARHGIEALMDLRPEVAVVRRSGEEVSVPVEDVLPGEVFVLRPGGRVPLDGVIVEGSSSLDQAAITGESVPVPRGPGEEVYAGTMNVDGFLAVEVNRMAGETMLARIQRLVEEAEESRSETEAFVDRFSRWYTPSAIMVAVLVATMPPLVLGEPLDLWVYRALVMLVVACPCALAISTPVAMVSAISSASRNGVLVKGGAYIEGMSRAATFAFDKTGTLTEGRLEVVDIQGDESREVLRCAASLESKSEHPIAQAILERARSEGVDVPEAKGFKTYLGRGVTATLGGKTYCVGNPRLFTELGIVNGGAEANGNTVILVSEDDRVIGSLALADRLKPGVGAVVSELRRRGARVEMLTGDNESTAATVAEKIGVDGYRAGLLPEEKVEAVKSLRDRGPVVMVGDGVNDAPALAAADVGVAMGAMGSDVALETADIALMRDDLSKVPYVLDLSRATMRRIRENIALSLAVKLGIAALALFGFVSLWMAVAVGDMGLSLAVILNSMRLSRVKPGTPEGG